MTSKKQATPTKTFPWYIPLIFIGSLIFVISGVFLVSTVSLLDNEITMTDATTATTDAVDASLEEKLESLVQGTAFKYAIEQCHKICGPELYNDGTCHENIKGTVMAGLRGASNGMPIEAMSTELLHLMDKIMLQQFQNLFDGYDTATDAERAMIRVILCDRPSAEIN